MGGEEKALGKIQISATGATTPAETAGIYGREC